MPTVDSLRFLFKNQYLKEDIDLMELIASLMNRVNDLENAGYQTETQVNALIDAYMQTNYDNGDTRSY